MKERTPLPFGAVASFAFLLILVTSCSLDTPNRPTHDNPWDPDNPSAPRAPGGLTGRVLSETSLSLHWQDRSGNETGFLVEEALLDSNAAPVWVVVDSTSADADSVVFQGRNPATHYLYRVIAINPAGQSAPTTLLELSTSDVPPTAPTSLVVTPVDGVSLQLTWQDCSANEERFEVNTSSDSLYNFTVLTAPADSVHLLFNGLDPFTTVYYKVRAVNGFGFSDFTTTASGTPGAIPLLPPTNITAFATSETVIHLEWADPNLTTERIDLWESASDSLHFFLVDSVIAGVRSKVFPDRTPGVTYYYRVSARNRFGVSSVSQCAHTSTAEVDPYSPTNLRVELVNELDLVLTWEDHSNIETGFELAASLNDSLHWLVVDSLPPDATIVLQPDREPFVAIYYRIRAFGSGGVSAWTRSARKVPGSVPPAPPIEFSVEALASTTAELHWVDATRIETQYEIQKSAGGAWSFVGTAVPNASEYSINSLAPNTTYTFRIHAINGYGASPWVVSAAITTPGPPVAPRAVTAEGISATEIHLIWRMDQNRHTGFLVEDSAAGGVWTPSGDTIMDPAQREYLRAGCSRYTRYYFRIKAFNEYGDSPFSSAANAIPHTIVAFVAVNNNGVDAVDISDPANPVRIGNTTLDGLAQRVTIRGNLAYVPASYGGVQLLDITSPVNVTPITSFDTDGRAYFVAVNGQTVYCADGDSGVVILQLDNLNRFSLLSQVSTWPGSVHNLTYLNNNLYAAAQSRGVLRIQVSNPRSPSIQQEAATGSSAMSLCQLGNSAQLLSAEYSAFRVLAVPSLSETSSFATQFATEIVDKDASTAYLTIFGQGIGIMDISSPANPQILGGLISMPDDVWGLTVFGDLLLAAVDNAGLIIFDISDPRTPHQVGQINTTGPARGVGVKEYR